jgi:alpha-galactosidase/6-phospho-beta-glucosidase family protein
VLETYQEHGVFLTIGDTLYSPGLIQWLLEYRTLVEIRDAVNELASPDCVVFATANPLPEVTGLLAGSGLGEDARPVFGFCCGTKDLRRLFESYLEAPNASLTLEYAARNHLGMLRLFDASGNSALPGLLDRLHPDRLFYEIAANGPNAQRALEDWPLAMILHRYYDPQAGTVIASESGVHGIEYLPRLFQDANRRVKYPASIWEHDLFRRQDKTEDNRFHILNDPLDYELKTSWAVGRFDPWSQVLRNLRQDPELTEKDLRHWGPAYVNVPNGDLFPELPPGAVVEVPTTYHAGQMFVYRNSVPLSDDYLSLVYPHLQMAEMAGGQAQTGSRLAAIELFEWLIDACPLVNAYLPERDRRLSLAHDLMYEIPHLLPSI